MNNVSISEFEELINIGTDINRIGLVTFDKLLKERKNDIIKILLDKMRVKTDILEEIAILSITNRNFEILKYIVETYSLNLNKECFVNCLTQMDGKSDIIEYVLSKITDVYILDVFLIENAKEGNIGNLELALKLGIDINARGQNALYTAISKLKLDVIKFLAENGAHIHADKDEPLVAAARTGDDNIVRYFLDQGLDVHTQNEAPLYEAVNYEKLNIVKLLIEYGADINVNDGDILIYAYRLGNMDIVMYLIDVGADIHVKEDELFLCACKNGDLELVKFLIEKGADVNAKDGLPLIYAVHGNTKTAFDVIKCLVENGADVSLQNQKAFVIACSHSNNLDIVKYFVNAGVDVTADNNKALVEALQFSRNEKIPVFLIKNGANTDDINAIHSAVKERYSDALTKLAKNNKNLFVDNEGYCPFVLVKNRKLVLTPFGIDEIYNPRLAKKYEMYDDLKKQFEKFIEKCKKVLNIQLYGDEFTSACQTNNYTVIQQFLDYGFNVENDNLVENLKNLIAINSFSIFRIIVEGHVKKETFDKIKEELFVYSSAVGKRDFIRYFVENGINIYALNNEALYNCVLRNDENLLDYFSLLDNNIVYFKTEEGIILYISGQDIVFKLGFEGSLNEFKYEDPVMYEKILKNKKAIA